MEKVKKPVKRNNNSEKNDIKQVKPVKENDDKNKFILYFD